MSDRPCWCFLGLTLAAVTLGALACAAPMMLASTPEPQQPSAIATPAGGVTPVATTALSFTAETPTPEPARVQTALRPDRSTPLHVPAVYTTTLLPRFVHPQTYVENLCEYLRCRWNPDGSAPGTVVVPIMFHDITEGGAYRPGDNSVPEDDLRLMVQTALELGFQTITSNQLVQFLDHNCSIPPRSMIWIVDDRRPQVLAEYFVPIARANGWTITLAWPVDSPTANAERWAKYLRDWHAEGLLDVQSHGMKHVYITDSTPDADIEAELRGPIESLRRESGAAPVAYVWPGGNYTAKAVLLARHAGYRIGFTINSRGPLMYNWIPLAHREMEVGDPLMLLPRYPASPDLPELLRKSAAIGDAAAASARSVSREETLWYEATCGCELPALRPAP